MNIQQRILPVLALFGTGLCGSVAADPVSHLDFYVYTHVQQQGQMTFAPDEWAGTRGQQLRLESLAVTPLHPNLGNWPSCLQLSYMAHLQGTGDTGWTNAPNKVGTEGQSRRIEGVAFRLAGSCAQDYTVEYRCHLQNIGDSALLRDGQFCGSRGQSRQLEAIKLTVRHK
ncbi:hypothetical protein A5320_12080 [Rheinheimera sp. SA_1]|uniref:hypothetical protein n=1 Tax=Rheinheimera sp. SA_1 TaxID=1827365 RepID=UPI0007FF906A|nr:hypothetical protein [Rheinheimera sp. SA_1]OBP14500.1 hypothetical protein A5320_12080 [Rheinheimera sp. SA_1]